MLFHNIYNCSKNLIMIKASLVIPTYNEAMNIQALIDEIFRNINKKKIDLEIIFVDDNSPDGTGKIAEELAGNFPVKVIHRPGKLGLGSAVIDGFNLSKREYIGVMDGDLSHDPIILNDLILRLIEYDITIGSRFEAGSVVEGWNFWRKTVSYLGVYLASLLVGVKDPLSGYFFLNRRVIDNVKLDTRGYKILFEILVKGKYESIKEFSYFFRMRKYSTSKLNFKEFIYYLLQVIEYAYYKLVNKY